MAGRPHGERELVLRETDSLPCRPHVDRAGVNSLGEAGDGPGLGQAEGQLRHPAGVTASPGSHWAGPADIYLTSFGSLRTATSR